MKFEIISISALVVLAIGFSKCADKSIIEGSIRKGLVFRVDSKEYKCEATKKQIEIDRVLSVLRDIENSR